MSIDYDLAALGKQGTDGFVGLETFPNPGVDFVEMTSDEFTAVCPVTGQPDQYTVTLYYHADERCIESKSLKLYLGQFRNRGAFCEALAVEIGKDAAAALDVDVIVDIEQKSRGGITILANVRSEP